MDHTIMIRCCRKQERTITNKLSVNIFNKERPLSPHLSIYRLQWTSGYSILHRLSGIILAFGTVASSVWLITLATNVESFLVIHSIFTSFLGKVLLMSVIFSLYYHLLNGIRHLMWDIGYGIDLKIGRISGHVCGIVSVIITFFSAVLIF